MPAIVLQQTDPLRAHELSADAALLDYLTSPTPPSKGKFARRDAALDPLLLAVAAASGPHVTRNHYHHNFLPPVQQPSDEHPTEDSEQKRVVYVSRQAPRRQRLQNILNEGRKENDATFVKTIDYSPPYKRRLSQSNNVEAKFRPNDLVTFTKSPKAPLEIRCMARTRIPTPHGPIFLHLYHNNHDMKEHLAIVVDPAQLSPTPDLPPISPIRSRSLDSRWSENETDMDRIVRGAYIGRLSSESVLVAAPQSDGVAFNDTIPPPLIRIHSECFTGETIGSMRCDCGEQLDEAIRRISQPLHIGNATIPGRGAVIYLRQEGRGIGLLSKIRAYNLQDLGHDTVTANLMLGYKADERGYEIAAAILDDLGLGSRGKGNGVRVLTNNPDKVDALRKEGIDVFERVPMIPRSWQQRQPHQHGEIGEERSLGATMVGSNAVHGEDLDKYLRTKILRMGHMLPLWLDDVHRVE